MSYEAVVAGQISDKSHQQRNGEGQMVADKKNLENKLMKEQHRLILNCAFIHLNMMLGIM